MHSLSSEEVLSMKTSHCVGKSASGFFVCLSIRVISFLLGVEENVSIGNRKTGLLKLSANHLKYILKKIMETSLNKSVSF
jgi:hypothetical protein